MAANGTKLMAMPPSRKKTAKYGGTLVMPLAAELVPADPAPSSPRKRSCRNTSAASPISVAANPPHHTVGLPTNAIVLREPSAPTSTAHRPNGCCISGQAYHGEAAGCLTSSNETLPRHMALCTSASLCQKETRTDGSY